MRRDRGSADVVERAPANGTDPRIANADITEQQILQSMEGEPASVRVDLTGPDHIDSAGLWILFRLAGSLTDAGIAGEVVVPVDGPVRRMVETAGVSPAIPVRTR